MQRQAGKASTSFVEDISFITDCACQRLEKMAVVASVL